MPSNNSIALQFGITRTCISTGESVIPCNDRQLITRLDARSLLHVHGIRANIYFNKLYEQSYAEGQTIAYTVWDTALYSILPKALYICIHIPLATYIGSQH